LNESDRYTIARLIGRITHSVNKDGDKNIMIFGPGRWGTSMPSLGVPVSFNDINNVSVLCEIDSMHEGLVPDLSLGTHFFNEMVEMNMLYLAFFKNKQNNYMNDSFFAGINNKLLDLFSNETKFENAIKVLFASDLADNKKLVLHADALKQKSILFLK